VSGCCVPGISYALFFTTSDFSVHYQHGASAVCPFTPDIQIESKILLAGRVWIVKDIDVKAKRLLVEMTKRRRPPKFISDEGFVSNEVRENMEKLLRTGEYLTLNNDKITRDFDFLKAHSTSMRETIGMRTIRRMSAS
jgi:ATP-dependent Lhr-like helicase